MAKLTLSVDDAVIERAKASAERRHTSVSALVERYLARLTEEPQPSRNEPPVLARLRGALAGAKAEEHRAHFERKYR